MGKPKTIYIRDEDFELWDRAQELAKARRMNMSALILHALERLVDEEERR